MKKILLCYLTSVFISVNAYAAVSEYQNLTNNNNKYSSFGLDKMLRFGGKIGYGPSLATFILASGVGKKIKESFSKDIGLNTDSKLKMSSKFPLNFEIFVGYRPIKWVGFDLGFIFNKTTGFDLDLTIKGKAKASDNLAKKISENKSLRGIKPESSKKASANVQYNFRQIGLVFRTMFFQGGFYEGIGVKIKYMIHGKMNSSTKNNVSSEVEKIPEKYRAKARKKLKEILGDDMRGSKKNFAKSKNISNWGGAGILYLGYEFFFGLFLEFSFELEFGLSNAFKLKDKLNALNIDEDITNPENNLIIKSFESLAQPVFNVSIGYNFARLL